MSMKCKCIEQIYSEIGRYFGNDMKLFGKAYFKASSQT